ncbi:hypothetical protein AB0C34_23670 [Nocardia sp. NPDC049220]|uniref:hypothetical protein n=1 Tax=Nocardia sp. NPDC049220 TaxID=3155273 RepID=UPI0033F0BA4F
MNMRIHQLSASVGPAAHLKIALNGNWELALIIGPKDLSVADSTVRSFIDSADDVAFEVFFEPKDTGIAFLGVRLNGMGTETRTSAIVRCLEDISGPERLSLFDVIERARQHIHATLFSAEPALLEVGVEGLWKSVGSVVLWRQGDETLDRPAMEERLRSNLRLFDSQPNPLGLEFAFDEPLPHWIATQCSCPSGDGFTVDVDMMYDRAIQFTFGGRGVEE